MKPEIIHVNELGLVKYWKKVVLNATGYYRFLKDKRRRFLTNEGLVSTVSFKNIGTSTLLGGEFILTYTPMRGVRISSVTNIWNNRLSDDIITQGETQTTTGMSQNLSIMASLKNGLTMQLWGNYNPRMEVNQGVILAQYGMGVALQKSVLKKKGSISIRFSDILNSRAFQFKSHDLDGYEYEIDYNWESRGIHASFSYNFGKVIKGKQKRRAKNNSNGDNKSTPGL